MTSKICHISPSSAKWPLVFAVVPPSEVLLSRTAGTSSRLMLLFLLLCCLGAEGGRGEEDLDVDGCCGVGGAQSSEVNSCAEKSKSLVVVQQ